MSSNYEWNRALTQQRLQSRYDEAARQRQARAGREERHETRRLTLRWLNPFAWLAALWRRRPRREARPVGRPAHRGAR
jgi:hypothetical protein